MTGVFLLVFAGGTIACSNQNSGTTEELLDLPDLGNLDPESEHKATSEQDNGLSVLRTYSGETNNNEEAEPSIPLPSPKRTSSSPSSNKTELARNKTVESDRDDTTSKKRTSAEQQWTTEDEDVSDETTRTLEEEHDTTVGEEETQEYVAITTTGEDDIVTEDAGEQDTEEYQK